MAEKVFEVMERKTTLLVTDTAFTQQEIRDLETVFDAYDPAKQGNLNMKDFRKVKTKIKS